MFVFYFKYSIRRLLRDKQSLFWSLAFPILLGTLFQVAFGSMGETELLTEAIPVAVVVENKETEKTFMNYAKEAILSDNVKMFEMRYVSYDEAKELLENKEVMGAFLIGDDVKVKISGSSINEDGIKKSIITNFASMYKQVKFAIEETSKTNPELIQSVIDELLMSSRTYGEDKEFGNGNMDTYIQYFYNLLAMCCVLSSTVGLGIPINNQGNLSSIGARKCASPKSRVLETLADISATTFTQFSYSIIVYGYLSLIGVDFGSNVLLIIFTLLVGIFCGVSFGYFVGSFGKMSANIKEAISISVSMCLCFLSGLMMANMRRLVEMSVPIVNKISPPALLSDAFFSLDMYSDLTRYMSNITNLLIVSAVFIIIGLINTRRESYASI